VADVVAVAVPRGGRLVVTSDLHLVGRAGVASTRATEALAAALDAWDGPGAAVLAGDCFEMLAEPGLDPGPALDAHPALTAALAGWAAHPDREVLVLPGNHDGALAWHAPAAATLRQRLGATVALAVDAELATAAGPRRVRVEHGHQLDPANAFVDPRDPAETPLGHHVVQDLLPLLDGVTGAGWAGGVELVADPIDVPALVASRLAYRRVAPVLAATVVPFLVAAALAPVAPAAARAALAVAVVAAVAVVGGAVTWGAVAWRAFRGLAPDLSGGAEPGNEAPRRRAGLLVAEGVDGYVSGHTHIPEVTDLGPGLYANPGCGGGLLHRRPGRGPLPDAWVVARHVSWVELDAGAALEARLVVGHEEAPGTTRLERLATRPAPPGPPTPTVVATVVPAPASEAVAP
jgi:hypothetical protein